MRCKTARYWIQLELDGELSQRQRARLRTHLAACPDCAGVRHQFTAIQASLQQISGTAAEPDYIRPVEFTRRRRVAPRAVLAAMAAALAAAIGLWFTVNHLAAPAPSDEVVRHAPDAASGVQPTKAVVQQASPGNLALAEAAAERSAALDQTPEPRTRVHVRMSSEPDSIVLPVETKNPNVSIFWIYPAVRTAQIPAHSSQNRVSPS
jgi:predicted anti-sigma-YlaC factor YlaD